VGALAVAAVSFSLFMPEASALTQLDMSLVFPKPVTVGQAGNASLTLRNIFSDARDSVTVRDIRLVPSCTTEAFDDCPLASADLDVFAIGPTATGAAGTVCAGVTFTVSVVNPATGQVSFNPSTPVVLSPPPSPNSVCRVDFTFSVLKKPLNPPGTFTTNILYYAFGVSPASDGRTSSPDLS